MDDPGDGVTWTIWGCRPVAIWRRRSVMIREHLPADDFGMLPAGDSGMLPVDDLGMSRHERYL